MADEESTSADAPAPGLPGRAQAFLVATGLAALAVSVPAALHGGETRGWATFGLLLGAASVAQLFAFHTVRNQVFHTTPLFYVAGALLLPPQLLVLLPLLSHLPDWIRKRYAWYIQTFNILNFTLAIMCGWAASRLVHQELAGREGSFAAAAAAAAVVYFVANNGGFVAVLHLARGHRPRDILNVQTLAADAALASLGVVLASFWRADGWLVPFALTPIFLLHAALHLPQLREEARADAMTGLANSRQFREALTEELTRARRFGRPLSLIVADVDLFRNVNATYGHFAGDAVLGGVAEIFRSHLRQYDVAARLSGEEFAIVLPETTGSEAVEIADRIREAVARTPIWAESARRHVNATISVGVASFPAQGTDPDDLLRQADLAAYHAKLQGRNRVLRAGRRPVLISARSEPAPAEAAAPVAPGLGLAVAGPGGPAAGAAAPALDARLPRLFAAAVAAAGAVALGLAVAFGGSDDLLGLLVVGALAAAGEAIGLDLDHGSISAGPVVALAASAMFGVRAAAVAAVTVAVDLVARRAAGRLALLNLGARALSLLAAAAIFAIGWESSSGAVVTVAVGPLAGVVAFVVASGLASVALGLEGRDSWWRAWRSRFAWLVPHYAVCGFVAGVAAIAYRGAGFWALAAFAVSLLAIRRTLQALVEQGRRSDQGLRSAAQTIETQNATLERVNRLLTQRSLSALESLSAIVDARDAYDGGHSRRVRDYAVAMGRELGLSGAELVALARAARFHDVGKLTVPDTILLAPRALAPDETEAMRRHADEGARIIDRLGFLEDVVPAIRHHHERIDGTGYPSGLAGGAIPLAARIVHVAEAYDSMRTNRVYQATRSPTEAMLELRRRAGSQFCPLCVDALERVLASGKFVGERIGDGGELAL